MGFWAGYPGPLPAKQMHKEEADCKSTIPSKEKEKKEDCKSPSKFYKHSKLLYEFDQMDLGSIWFILFYKLLKENLT